MLQLTLPAGSCTICTIYCSKCFLARVTPRFLCDLKLPCCLNRETSLRNGMVSYAAPKQSPKRQLVSEVQNPTWE